MTYVIDTSVVSVLHKNYYRTTFTSMWKLFDEMVTASKFTSCREAFRELEDYGGVAFDWAKTNEGLFVVPDAKEAAFVGTIYGVKHFRANIEQQKLFKGGKCADPFLIARANAIAGTVLTMEHHKPNAAKIPNICEHFKVPCVDLQKFMENEKWKF